MARLRDAAAEPAGGGSSGSPSPPLPFVISQPAEGHSSSQRGSPPARGSNEPASAALGSSGLSGGAALASAVAPAAPAAGAEAAPASPGPEQIVVLMDCHGASTLNAARISWVFKAVASSLGHHYPGRCGAGQAGGLQTS